MNEPLQGSIRSEPRPKFLGDLVLLVLSRAQTNPSLWRNAPGFSKTAAHHCSSCLCVLCSRRCTWSVSTSSLVRSMKISVLPPTTWTSPTSREWITRWDSWRTEEILTVVNVLYPVFNYSVSYKLPAIYNKCFTWYLNVAGNQGCRLLVCK